MARPNKRNRQIQRLGEQITSLGITQTTVKSEKHAGPLPAPDILNAYNQIIPGLADRIVKMAEDESPHRRELERQLLIAQMDDAKSYRKIEFAGQVSALVVSCVTIIGGVVVIAMGHAIAGGFLGGSTLMALVGLFIYGRERRYVELRANKNQQPAETRNTLPDQQSPAANP